MGIPIRGPWSAELTYGWTSFDVRAHVTFEPGPLTIPDMELPFGQFDLHFLELGVRWEVSGEGPIRPFLILAPGITFARFGNDLLLLGEELDWLSDPALGLGGGLVWEVREGVGIRLDARDHVRFCSDACFPEATLHDIELSAGIALDF